jgi:plastocyanin
MPEGGIVKRLLMYVTPLSAMAVLVFAAIAAAQSIPQGQEATTPAETIASAPNRTITRGTLPINDHAFDPAQLSIASGTTLTIVNTDTEKHTATADNGLFDTGVLEPGESFEIYFDGSGTVTYHCELHPDMKGSIIVGEGGGGEDPTAAPKQTAEEAPNEPSGDTDQPGTEAANHPEVIR